MSMKNMTLKEFHDNIKRVGYYLNDRKTCGDFEQTKQYVFGNYSEHLKFILTEHQVVALAREIWESDPPRRA